MVVQAHPFLPPSRKTAQLKALGEAGQGSLTGPVKLCDRLINNGGFERKTRWREVLHALGG